MLARFRTLCPTVELNSEAPEGDGMIAVRRPDGSPCHPRTGSLTLSKGVFLVVGRFCGHTYFVKDGLPSELLHVYSF